MISFSSRTTHKSVTQPGVEITLRRIGPKLRAEIEMRMSADLTDEADALADFVITDHAVAAMIEEIGFNDDGEPKIKTNPELVTPEHRAKALEARNLYRKVIYLRRSKLWPPWIEAGLISLEGITVDDEPMTAKTLIESGPDDLYEEVFTLIHEGTYINPTEARDSQSSTTGSTAAAGEASVTTVETAGNADSTKPNSETATSTSPI